MAEIPAHVVARIDQAFSGAQDGLQDMIDEAREMVAEHGPAKAAALLSVMHVESVDHNPYVLGGTLALALVELARREVL